MNASTSGNFEVVQGARTSSKVLCVLVNFHDRDATQACIRSIRTMNSESDQQIVVVDNDVSSAQPDSYLGVGADHVISSPLNLGFGGGVNLAIRTLGDHRFDYIWLLNNDAVATSNSLSALIKTLEENDADMAGSTIFYMDEPELLWCEYSHCHKPWHIVQNVGKKQGLKSETRDRDVNFINGCSTLIRREVFEEQRGFDESLFLYAEDLDLCIRCTEAGSKLFSSAGSKIFHAVSSSTGGEFNVLREYYIARNGYAMIHRYVEHPLVKNFAIVTRIPWDAYRFLRTALNSGEWRISGKYLLRAIYDGCTDRLGRVEAV